MFAQNENASAFHKKNSPIGAVSIEPTSEALNEVSGTLGLLTWFESHVRLGYTQAIF